MKSNDYKTAKDVVYYNLKHDHLILLQWIGNRFYIFYEDSEVTMKATSKRFPSLLKGNLFYIGDL